MLICVRMLPVQIKTRFLVHLGSFWAFLRCFLTKKGSVMRDFQDLQTHLKQRRDSTGKLERISAMISSGKIGVYDG